MEEKQAFQFSTDFFLSEDSESITTMMLYNCTSG